MSRVKVFWRNSLFFRWSGLIVAASAVAYTIASFFDFSSPSIAAFTAALMIQGSVHESVKESLQQVVGVVLGAALGLALMAVLGGLGVVALVIATTSGFIFAAFVKMGIHSAISMTVPIIVIVGGQSLSLYTLEQRASGVAIGIIVALIASFATRSGKPTDRITLELKRVNLTVSETLSEIAEAISAHKVSAKQVSSWERNNTKLLLDVFQLKEEAETALEGVKYSPFVTKETAEHALAEVNKTLWSVTSAISMVESFKETYQAELRKSKKKSETEKLNESVEKVKKVKIKKPSTDVTLTETCNGENENPTFTSALIVGNTANKNGKARRGKKVNKNNERGSGVRDTLNTTMSEMSTDDVVEVNDTVSPIISQHVQSAANLVAEHAQSLTAQKTDGTQLSTKSEEDALTHVMNTRNEVKNLVKESEETKELILGGSMIVGTKQITEMITEKPATESGTSTDRGGNSPKGV